MTQSSELQTSLWDESRLILLHQWNIMRAVLWNMMFLTCFCHSDSTSVYYFQIQDNLIWTVILKSYLILELSTRDSVRPELEPFEVFFAAPAWLSLVAWHFSHRWLPLCLQFSRRHATCVAECRTSACFADGTSAFSWASSRLQLQSRNLEKLNNELYSPFAYIYIADIYIVGLLHSGYPLEEGFHSFSWM